MVVAIKPFIAFISIFFANSAELITADPTTEKGRQKIEKAQRTAPFGFNPYTSIGASIMDEVAHPTRDIKDQSLKPEAKKVKTEEDLKCGFTVSCQRQEIEGQGQKIGQPPGTPSTPSISTQANTAKTVTQQNYVNTRGSSSYSSNRGGITEVTSGGRKIGIRGGGIVYNLVNNLTLKVV